MYQTDKVQSTVDQLSRVNPFYGREGLQDPPRPDEKSIPRDLSAQEQIPHIQRQLDLLTYNHLPHTFFNLEKHRALQSILMTGKEALTEALPVRCLEATFIGMYLTQENKDIDRIPLSFRSAANGNHYQHIVLVVHLKQPASLYGALGLSRKRTLMYKPPTYRSLYEIVMDYKREYEALGHELIDIKLGLSVTHDVHSRLMPCWRFVALKLAAFSEPSSPAPLATHAGSPATSSSRTMPPASHPQSCQPPARPPSRSSVASSSRLGASQMDTAPVCPLTKSPTLAGVLSVSGSSQMVSIAVSPQLHAVLPTESIHETTSGSAETASPFVSPTMMRPPDTGAAAAVAVRLSLWPRSPSPTTPANATPVSTQPAVSPFDSAVAAAAAAAESATVTPPPVIARPASSARVAREDLSPLAQFLGKYSRLLPVMTEQYYKGYPLVDSTNRHAKVCFMSLEEAERDAKMENSRRIELILKLQSPLSLEARKAAANRQLKSERGKERRSQSHAQPPADKTPATGGRRPGGKTAARPATAVTSGLKRNAGRSAVGRVAAPPLRMDGLPPGEASMATARPRDVIAKVGVPREQPGVTDSILGERSRAAAGSSTHSFPSLPPTPRNESTDLSPPSLFSGATSSSSGWSDDEDGFLTDRNRTEGGS